MSIPGPFHLALARRSPYLLVATLLYKADRATFPSSGPQADLDGHNLPVVDP